MNGMVPPDKMQDFPAGFFMSPSVLSNLVADIIQLSRLDEKNGETMFEQVDIGELGGRCDQQSAEQGSKEKD